MNPREKLALEALELALVRMTELSYRVPDAFWNEDWGAIQGNLPQAIAALTEEPVQPAATDGAVIQRMTFDGEMDWLHDAFQEATKIDWIEDSFLWDLHNTIAKFYLQSHSDVTRVVSRQEIASVLYDHNFADIGFLERSECDELAKALAGALGVSSDTTDKSTSEISREIMTLEDDKLGSWMSAALSDPSVCKEMKQDIRAWFDQFTSRYLTSPEREKIVEALRAAFGVEKRGLDMPGFEYDIISETPQDIANLVYSIQLSTPMPTPSATAGSGPSETVAKIEMELDELGGQMRDFAGDFQDGSEEQNTVEEWSFMMDHPDSRIRNLLTTLKGAR